MRIIQGKYKGYTIEGFRLKGTRPTMERVKESLFAILQPYLDESICLDLFAGSGNLGIEALSMGAKEVCFVDFDKDSFSTIQKNLKKLKLHQEVYCMDFQTFLKKNPFHKKYHIVFLDPPYQSNYIEIVLSILQKNDLLEEKGMVVCESDSLDKILFDHTYYLSLKQKKYGDKYIEILQKR